MTPAEALLTFIGIPMSTLLLRYELRRRRKSLRKAQEDTPVELAHPTWIKLSLAEAGFTLDPFVPGPGEDATTLKRKLSVELAGKLLLSRFQTLPGAVLLAPSRCLVFHAKDTHEGMRPVTLKIIRPSLSSDGGSIPLGMAEAFCLANGDGYTPTLVAAYILEEQYACVVTHTLRGHPLVTTGRSTPYPFKEQLRLALALAKAADHLHRRVHVAHRDIKPDNILVRFSSDKDGAATFESLHLLDFDLAHLDPPPHMENETIIRCTPAYAAPEVCVGAHVYPYLADQFSIGITLTELATGEPLTSRSNAMNSLMELCTGVYFDRAQRALADQDARYAALLLKMLATNPNDRYKDMRAVIEELEQILALHA